MSRRIRGASAPHEMTGRGRGLFLVGLIAYLAAWAFGSKALYPVAVGFLLAVWLAWLWVRVSDRPVQVYRSLPAEYVEGDDVHISVDAEGRGVVPPPSLELVEQIRKLGEQTVRLRGRGRARSGSYVLAGLRRGRYQFEQARLVVTDPFGLARAQRALPLPGALLVYPRLVQLERLFSEAGGHSLDGRRLQLRRPTGFDLHSVRDYEQGESLQRVHWRTTARRGRLMVKELENAPREEVAVLLDANAAAVVGESFDVQVRAAGSIMEAHLRRGRRAVLIVNSSLQQGQREYADARDRRRALEVLAAVDPVGTVPVSSLLGGEASAAGRALDVTVVTAQLTGELVDRLVQRSLSRRGAALVYVEAATFAGAEPVVHPALVRLQAAGVAVAVVRAGDDLALRLGGPAAATTPAPVRAFGA